MTATDGDQLAGRHPGVTELLSYFEHAHLPDHLQGVSRPCGELARTMVAELPDGPELTTGLRKLLEAKDCFVRQALRTTITRGPATPPRSAVRAEPIVGSGGPVLGSAVVTVEDRVTEYLDGQPVCGVALPGMDTTRCELLAGHMGPHASEGTHWT